MLTFVKKPLRALYALMLPALQRFFFLCARDLDATLAPGSTLVLAPHPDDETLGCGAVIARLRAAGRRVVIIIITDGAASGHSTIITPKELAVRRRQEVLDAGDALGVLPEDMVFLDFVDSATAAHAKEIEAALGVQITKIAPGQIFSPYGVDGNPDHRTVAAAMDGLRRAGLLPCPIYEYPIWFWTWGAMGHLLCPWKLLRLRRVATHGYLAVKEKALAAHRSQHEALTSEAGWFVLDHEFLARFLVPYELFFEQRPSGRQA